MLTFNGACSRYKTSAFSRSFYIKLELTRDRLRSFVHSVVRSFVTFRSISFVCYCRI